MDDYGQYDQWSVYYDPQAYAAANFSWNEPTVATPPSDPAVTADVTAAKAKAVAIGDTKFASVLDFILKYGDRALTTLSKNGIIKNQNLMASGYSYVDFNTGQRVVSDATSNAPAASNRVFNIDFTDPKVLIIIFLILMGIGYFLLKPNATAKR